MKTLGDLIQIKRYEKNLTLTQLAEKMGIAMPSLRAWEQDESQPHPNQFHQLIKFLGFTEVTLSNLGAC